MAETVIKPKNSYELHILLSPAGVDGDLSGTEEAIGNILQKHEAQIERSDRFAKQDLAYNMQKFGYAYAANIFFFAPAENIEEIVAELNTSDIPFLRIMVTRVEKKAKVSAKPRRRRPKVAEEEEKEEEKTAAKTKEEVSKPEPEPETESKEKEVEQEKAPADTETKEGEEKEATESKDAEEDEDDKVTLDDIDKRLDEIMEQL